MPVLAPVMPRPGFSFFPGLTRTRRLAASLYNTGGARALHRIATKRDELRLPCFKTSTLEVCSDHDGLKPRYGTLCTMSNSTVFNYGRKNTKNAWLHPPALQPRRHDGARARVSRLSPAVLAYRP